MSFDLKAWLQKQVPGSKLPISILPLNDIPASDTREWLVTNGLGSYAGGSLTGANTRRYHGLLTAALEPPVRRTLLFSRVDEVVSLEGDNERLELATNFWSSGAVGPHGYKNLEAFSNLPVPTWCYRVHGGHLIKQVFMKNGEQRVYVGYTYVSPLNGRAKAKAPALNLELNILLNYRDFHGQTKGNPDWCFIQDQQHYKKIKIIPYKGAQHFFLELSDGTYKQAPEWYWNYYWPREHERGLAEQEDLFRSGVIKVSLKAGQSVTLTAGLEAMENVPSVKDLVTEVAMAKKALIDKALGAKFNSPKTEKAATPQDLPDVVKHLVLAADQFLVNRQSTKGKTIIAGYPWFSDWGRDSMISLSGLCLATNRPEDARSILETFGKYMSEGMLPNYFPDGGQAPEYNTSDATFWWAQALYDYFEATGDNEFVVEQITLLMKVIDHHRCGTRHGLKLLDNGLITGGNKDVQLTWMDAKVNGYVVTPRSGTAVEITALFYNFVQILAYLIHRVYLEKHGPITIYGGWDKWIAEGFEQFWDEKRGYLADVIRQDESIDDSLRPNQLMAASLSFPLVSQGRAQSILKHVEAKLLTPMGLRTLSPKHSDYKGQYGLGKGWATQYDRDITYHQGTVWPWLLGLWVNARIYAYGENDANFTFIAEHLKALVHHIHNDGCIGSINEIFDGDSNHKAQGCDAQAWSVAELLRVLRRYPQIAEKL
jgi:predicted glycogen debranching enzyme